MEKSWIILCISHIANHFFSDYSQFIYPWNSYSQLLCILCWYHTLDQGHPIVVMGQTKTLWVRSHAYITYETCTATCCTPNQITHYNSLLLSTRPPWAVELVIPLYASTRIQSGIETYRYWRRSRPTCTWNRIRRTAQPFRNGCNPPCIVSIRGHLDVVHNHVILLTHLIGRSNTVVQELDNSNSGHGHPQLILISIWLGPVRLLHVSWLWTPCMHQCPLLEDPDDDWMVELMSWRWQCTELVCSSPLFSWDFHTPFRAYGVQLWGVLVSCIKGQVDGPGLACCLWVGLVRKRMEI